MSIIARGLPALLVLVLAVAGCGSASSSASSSVAATAATSGGGGSDSGPVVMKTLAFTPDVVHATVGQRLEWINEDNVAHNVTYESGPRFRSSRPVLNPGAKFSITLTQAGTIHYYCTIHPWMQGTIVVSP
jgi:plastocyanin